MQPYFYTFSLNNPLLSDVDLEANQIFTGTRRPVRLNTPSPKKRQQPIDRHKVDNRLSFLTRSTLSDDEPITPRSIYKPSLSLDTHTKSYSQHTLAIDKNGIRNSTEERTTFSTKEYTNDNENGNGIGNGNEQSIATTPDEDDDTTLILDDPMDNTETVQTHIIKITRTMQAFHVRELFWDEATTNMKKAKKRKRHNRRTTPDQHVVIDLDDSCDDFIFKQQQQQHQQDLARNHDDKEQCALLTKPTFNTLSGSSFAEKEASIQALWNPTNSTTDDNKRQCTMDEEDDEEDDDEDTIWREKYMSLMTSLIQQCEHLRYLSTELENTEHHVRSLLSLASTVQDQFHEREQHYQDRLKEVDTVSQRQSMMLDTLDELVADLDPLETTLAFSPPPPPPPPSSSSSFTHKARWNMGMLLGSNVGTGDMDLQPNQEMIVSGSGIIVDTTATITTSDHKSVYTTTKLSSQAMILYRYRLVLSFHDRTSLFALLPKHQWIPDFFVDHCQQCSVTFNWIQRKHHCRRCGKIVCQKHSGNRLPLFKTPDLGGWYRICDTCFIHLISSSSSTS